MTYPKCFDSQKQYDDWFAMAHSAVKVCADCTPSYAAKMRLEERCEHPEVRFYRHGNTYLGLINRETVKRGAETGWNVKWEPYESDAEKSEVSERTGVSV